MLHQIAAEIIEMIEALETGNPSHEALAASMRAIIEKLAEHPDVEDQLPPGFLENMVYSTDQLEQAMANQREAERRLEAALQNQQIAQAKFDRLADQLLDNQNDHEKGN